MSVGIIQLRLVSVSYTQTNEQTKNTVGVFIVLMQQASGHASDQLVIHRPLTLNFRIQLKPVHVGFVMAGREVSTQYFRCPMSVSFHQCSVKVKLSHYRPEQAHRVPEG